MLYRAVYIFLQWTWGILQNIVGAFIFLLFIKNKHYFWHGAIVTVWNSKTASLGIGMFIFIRKPRQGESPDKFTGQTDFDRTLVHEYGHTVQSVILGIMFLPIIALPSLLWCGLPAAEKYRKKNSVSYYIFTPKNGQIIWVKKIQRKKLFELLIWQSYINHTVTRITK